ncbi:hypothetical protein TCSYLVIO_007856 [Trypanosoma cruzi]|nr:hypothetical protein TCSYLVIO_007856 [Trypanosoma cruzi]
MRHPNLARGIPCHRQGVVLEGSPGGRRIRTHRTPGARWCGKGCLPGVQADIGHRITTSRADKMRLLPTLRQTGTRPADHRQLSVSVVPFLTLKRQDRPDLLRNLHLACPRHLLVERRAADQRRPAKAAAASSRPSTIRRHTPDALTPALQSLQKASHVDSATAPRSSQQVPHAQVTTKNVKRVNEQKTDNAPQQAPMTAVALQPLLCCNPHQSLSRDNPREALPHTLWECPRSRQLSIRLFGNRPSRTTAPFKTKKLATSLRTARRPLTNSGCKGSRSKCFPFLSIEKRHLHTRNSQQ